MPLLYKGSYVYVDDATRTCTYPPPVTTSHRDEKMKKLVQNRVRLPLRIKQKIRGKLPTF